jgi:F-type H+-transporting ATPase subunit c
MKIAANKVFNRIACIALALVGSLTPIASAIAEDGATGMGGSSLAPLGAGLAIGMAVVGGALGQGKVVGSMLESFGRNPSVGGKLLTPMILGMALIESLVILAFVIAFRM